MLLLSTDIGSGDVDLEEMEEEREEEDDEDEEDLPENVQEINFKANYLIHLLNSVQDETKAYFNVYVTRQ